MDFITGIPTSLGNESIFLVTDQLKNTLTSLYLIQIKAIEVPDSYVKNIFKLHRFPNVLVSDRDPKFTSNVWKELFHKIGTSLTMSTFYHPLIDGQV